MRPTRTAAVTQPDALLAIPVPIDPNGGVAEWVDDRSELQPGCGRTLGIQVDHTDDWQHLGPTAPHNSGILCNHHNPFKNNGYRIVRDDAGRWHTYRPDRTEIRPI